MAKLELRNVKKSFGATDVILGIDLVVQSGEFCVFVGPSGCGKSTLLRMIAGLEDITSGEVVIDGEVVNAISAARRGLAMVFQSYALYPHMSVRANLSFGLENLGTDKDEVTRRVNEAARMLQIEDCMNRRPGQLSGGQRQRVAIGRAVVREPRIFLFDEPLSNLDAELRVTMRGEISGLHTRLGNTMVYVTHDQIEAMTMADKIAVLRSGRLEQFGAPLELYNAPENLFVAGFIGSPRMNMFEAEVDHSDAGLFVRLKDGTRFEVPQGLFDVPQARSVTLGLRPGDMKLTDGPGIRIAVSGVEQLGSESFVFGETPAGEAVVFGAKGQTSVRKGASICLAPEPNYFHLFCRSSGKTLRSAQRSGHERKAEHV